MSVFINEQGEFNKFYGTSILSLVKNKEEFIPILELLKNTKKITPVNNLHLKIIDVFSQTLHKFIGDNCKAVENAFKKYKNPSISPYKYLDHDVMLPEHYKTKDFLNKHFKADFFISNNCRLLVVNHKIILNFDFKNKSEKAMFKKILSFLNKNYGISRKITKHIVLGYIYDTTFVLDEQFKKELKNFIPKKIKLEFPDIFQYNTIDSYKHYSTFLY